MSKSIIQHSKYCYVTGVTKDLHKHHIFNGNKLREFSEHEGLWVYLAWNVHRNLHDSSELARELKRIGQFYYEKTHSHDEFMNHVRKNYLDMPLSKEEKAKYGIDVEEFNILEDDLTSLLSPEFEYLKKGM